MDLFYRTKEDANEFIQKAFDYFNGRVNKINYPAILHIDWIPCFDVDGSCRLPNVITVYPSDLLEDYIDYDDFKIEIIKIIIHELFHIDQTIDYIRYIDDQDYSKYIEDAVESQTYLYIKSNMYEINKQFGLTIKNIECDNCNELLYSRRRYEGHLSMILSICYFNDYDIESKMAMNEIINYNINTHTGSIKAIINNKEIMIQYRDYLVPIDQLNKFFYDEYFSIKNIHQRTIERNCFGDDEYNIELIIHEFN